MNGNPREVTKVCGCGSIKTNTNDEGIKGIDDRFEGRSKE
jgi:hypothetical protein